MNRSSTVSTGRSSTKMVGDRTGVIGIATSSATSAHPADRQRQLQQFNIPTRRSLWIGVDREPGTFCLLTEASSRTHAALPNQQASVCVRQCTIEGPGAVLRRSSGI